MGGGARKRRRDKLWPGREGGQKALTNEDNTEEKEKAEEETEKIEEEQNKKEEEERKEQEEKEKKQKEETEKEKEKAEETDSESTSEGETDSESGSEDTSTSHETERRRLHETSSPSARTSALARRAGIPTRILTCYLGSDAKLCHPISSSDATVG